MHRLLLALTLLAVAIAVAGCGATATTAPAASEEATTERPAGTASTSAAPAPSESAVPVPPALEPPPGRTWFGMNLDWEHDTVAAVSDRIGVTPAVWVQFVRVPFDDGARGNLEGFFEQVGAANGIGLVTLEPHDGLEAVTDDAATEVAAVLDEAWRTHGVATLVRFAHEMNGSWYPWGQQPEPYIDAFRRVAAAVHDGSPSSAVIWAPNEGAGYPFTGGQYGAVAGSADARALDTDGNGELAAGDDPYAPYWPGGDAVDWVGMSLYFWGAEYPWGENEVAPPDRFAAGLTGRPSGAHDDDVPVPDFYAEYAEGHGKPMAVIETAALYDPSAPGPSEDDVKGAWFEQVFSASTREDFPRIGMINWFEWEKPEPEVDATIDWRLSANPALGRSLLEGVPADWLLFADAAD